MSFPRKCKQCGRGSVIVMARGWPCDIDGCISPLVKVLNDGGVETMASCCGHGRIPGNIILADGRELIISPDFETTRSVEKAFRSIHNPG